MYVYLIVDFWLIICGIIFANKRVYALEKNRDQHYISIYFFIVLLTLIFISAFRGDFSTDYQGYKDIYLRFSDYSLKDILMRGFLKYPEKGYLLLQYGIKSIFDDNLYIFIISSIVIVYSHIKQFQKQSLLCILSVVLFLKVGNYYVSFNLIRQVLSASIVLMGSKYLYERKMIKYFIFVLLASSLHTSALIMIPSYFLLNIKLKRKNFIISGIVILITFVALPYLISYIQKYYWQWYTSDGYGMNGYSIYNVVMPVFISVVSVILYNISTRSHFKRLSTDNMTNIWLNSTYMYLMFSLLGLNVGMMQRFTVFFSTYTILLLVKLVNINPSKRLISLTMVILLIIYGFITQDNQGYYFIWN